MDTRLLNEIVLSLNKKRVNQPCPRCSANNFSIVGESEISVERAQPAGLLGGLAGLSSVSLKTSMPVIIVTCDNCGYVSQHAKAALVEQKQHIALQGLMSTARGNNE